MNSSDVRANVLKKKKLNVYNRAELNMSSNETNWSNSKSY